MKRIFEDFFDNLEQIEIEDTSLDIDNHNYKFTIQFEWRDRFGQKEDGLELSMKTYNEKMRKLKYFLETTSFSSFEASDPRFYVCDYDGDDKTYQKTYPMKPNDFIGKFAVYSICFDYVSSINMKQFIRFINFIIKHIDPEMIAIFEYSTNNYKMSYMGEIVFARQSDEVLLSDYAKNIMTFYNNLPFLGTFVKPIEITNLYLNPNIYDYANVLFQYNNRSKEMNIECGDFALRLDDLIDNDEDFDIVYIQPYYNQPYRYTISNINKLDDISTQVIEKYGNQILTGKLRSGISEDTNHNGQQLFTAFVEQHITVNNKNNDEIPLLIAIKIYNIKDINNLNAK